MAYNGYVLNNIFYKEVSRYLIYFLVYFLFVIIINRFYSVSCWPLFVGGLVGLFIMPNIDHFLHIFVFKPQELTSQRVLILFKNKQYKESLNLLYDTRNERKELIFHTVLFQIILMSLTFWVVSSSESIFAKGLVLSFMLNLIIFNLKKFINKELIVDNQDTSRIYLIVQILALFIFSFML